MIGKPYSGKPNVRFDEGELEIEHIATTPTLYSTGSTRGKAGTPFFGWPYICYLLTVFHTERKLRFDNHTFNLDAPQQGLRVDHSRGILPRIHLRIARTIEP